MGSYEISAVLEDKMDNESKKVKKGKKGRGMKKSAYS